MTASTECPRPRECDWQPRLDRGGLSPKAQRALVESMADGGSWSDDEMDMLMRTAPLTYVRDICVTCGAVRDRGAP